MIRTCVSALCAGALCLLPGALSDPAAPAASPAPTAACPLPADASPRPDVARPAPVVDRSCKPTGPAEVSLVQTAASGSRVDLEWSVTPRRELRALEWELVLPQDGVRLDGARAGVAAEGLGETTRGTTAVSLPVDGAYRKATLVVRGVFEGSDETGATFDEPFEVMKHLTWGEPPLVAPLVVSPDAETGAPTTFVALPTAHRKGR